MTWRETTIIAAALALAISAARGEPVGVCKAPNVAREVDRPSSRMAMSDPEILHCRALGPCWTDDVMLFPQRSVMCLTPAEDAAAEARGRNGQ